MYQDSTWIPSGGNFAQKPASSCSLLISSRDFDWSCFMITVSRM